MTSAVSTIAGRREPRSEQSLWFPGLKLRPQAQVRLFCLPYAGGSAAIYARWPELLPPEVEVCAVQLPGRWNRLHEKPFLLLEDLIVELTRVLAPYLDRPFALFGHSMGALIAFEMARFFRRHELLQPVHLFVSGRRAPQIADPEVISPDVPEDQFVQRIARMNGTPKEVLENPELMQLLLPTLRADFTLCYSYQYISEQPLASSITVFSGADDPETSVERLQPWKTQTSGRFTIKAFPGDHFYLHSAKELLAQAIAASLGVDLKLHLL